MADYNIYIHDTSSKGNGLSSKTTPFANQGEGESPIEAFSGNVVSAFNKGQQFASSGFGGAIQQGVAALSKAVPWVAIVVAAVKITDKILTTTSDSIATYTGDNRFKMGYNNVKTIMSNIINPFGYAKNVLFQNLENQKENRQTQATNMLVGNSLINTTNRGV